MRKKKKEKEERNVGSYGVGHWSASFELREGGTAHEGVMTGLDPVIHENTAHQDKHLIRNSILLRLSIVAAGRRGWPAQAPAMTDCKSEVRKQPEQRYKSRIVGRSQSPQPAVARYGSAPALRPHDDPARRVADATRQLRPRPPPRAIMPAEPGGRPVSPRWRPGPGRNPCPWPRRRDRRIRSPPSRRCRRGEIRPS